MNSKTRKTIILLALFSILFISCKRLDNIPYSPKKTPAEFLKEQPYVTFRFSGGEHVLVQPSSTLFIYSLGLLTCLIGAFYLKTNKKQRSRLWWGIALVLWGTGALLAGTSYQAFGYEIKCAGREYCTWTSWWEVIYLICTAAAVDAMIMAQTYSSVRRNWRLPLRIYAAVKFLSYTSLTLAGAFMPYKFLVSFEFMILVSLPSMILFIIINSSAYKRRKNTIELLLLLNWIFLGIIMAAYFLYYWSGFGEKLWQQGCWFTANDVLHIGLAGWMLYIYLAFRKKMADLDLKIQMNEVQE